MNRLPHIALAGLSLCLAPLAVSAQDNPWRVPGGSGYGQHSGDGQSYGQGQGSGYAQPPPYRPPSRAGSGETYARGPAYDPGYGSGGYQGGYQEGYAGGSSGWYGGVHRREEMPRQAPPYGYSEGPGQGYPEGYADGYRARERALPPASAPPSRSRDTDKGYAAVSPRSSGAYLGGPDPRSLSDGRGDSYAPQYRQPQAQPGTGYGRAPGRFAPPDYEAARPEGAGAARQAPPPVIVGEFPPLDEDLSTRAPRRSSERRAPLAPAAPFEYPPPDAGWGAPYPSTNYYGVPSPLGGYLGPSVLGGSAMPSALTSPFGSPAGIYGLAGLPSGLDGLPYGIGVPGLYGW